MPHGLIVGQTESGKTVLALSLAKSLKMKNQRIAVLDHFATKKWASDFFTTDASELVAYLKKKDNHSCVVFIDEGGLTLDKFDPSLTWLGTTSRHWGHSVFFITHRMENLNLTMRSQASSLFLFNSNMEDSRELASNFNKPELKAAVDLPKGHFLYLKDRFSPVKRGVLTLGGSKHGQMKIA